MTEQFDNRQIIIDYLRGGCKGGDMGFVGIEIEQFVLDEDGERVPYDEKHGRLGVRDILEALSVYYPDVTRTENGDITGCSRAQAGITIEPSAQVEISIAPKLTLAEVEEEYENFDFRIGQLLKPRDYKLVPLGYDPQSKAADLPLIPKSRYRYMDGYFSRLPGMHAERMMRATASLQVSIDYSDEADAVRKMRIATLMGPLFSYLLDNIAVFEGEPNATPLRRLKVWREVDPARCGVVPGLFDGDFGFGAYADWLLSVPPIFVTRPHEHTTGAQPAAQVYADAPMTEADIEHLLGMVWPDVRLKHYVEIRQCDAVPFDVALGYAALVKGLFYGPTNLDLLEHALGVGDDGAWHYSSQDVEDAIDAIIADEMDAVVYGRSVGAWIDLLFQFAPDGLGVEADYLEALKDFRGL
jgi:glutamate--cysteine ligase